MTCHARIKTIWYWLIEQRIRVWKDAPHHISSRKCKSKQQQNTTTHLLEWPKLTTPSTYKDEEQQELSFIAGGSAKWCTALEGSLMFFYKTKHTLTIRSYNHAPWYLAEGVEKLHSHKTLHTNAYSSFIHNCQNLEATQVSFSRWMGKYTVVHPEWNISQC